MQLVRPERPSEVLDAPVTLVSAASVGRLAREAGQPVDPRRFRMLFDLDGCEPHEEDEWQGRRCGSAGRSSAADARRGALRGDDRSPDTGKRDLSTLHLISGYRECATGSRSPFGMLADVEVPGRVRVGDPVEPL